MSTLGVGLDLVDVERFTAVLHRRPRIVQRLFTEREQIDADLRPERLAARFAAKEATWKALGVGLGATALHDVEVQSSPSGEPQLVLRGAAARVANERGVNQWHVSLTHTARSAGAVVVGSAS